MKKSAIHSDLLSLYHGIIFNIHNVHQMNHTILFEPQLSWPNMVAYGKMFLTDAYVKPVTADKTQAKSYDLMELMPAQY